MFRRSKTTSKNMQERKLWKEQFESPSRRDRSQGAKSRQPFSDAKSSQISRCGACGISPTLDNLRPLALDIARNEQNQETALMPNLGVVFTVGGPLVYEERGRSVFMSEREFGHTLAVDRADTAE